MQWKRNVPGASKATYSNSPGAVVSVIQLPSVDEPHTRAGGHLGALWVERVLVNRVPPAAQRPERILAERGGLDLVGLTRSWADPPHEI